MMLSPAVQKPETALKVAPYLLQSAGWPGAGKHILAQHDNETMLVYQAYRPSIGRYAIEHGYLGGPEFSLSRMSWIKPNFLWMMYRSGWASKEGQESVLGLRISCRFFDGLLQAAVPSSFDAQLYPSREVWAGAVAKSDVRLQWDPDHAPSGARLERRAVQLGLRGAALAAFAKEQILEVIDMSAFVMAQRLHAQDDSEALSTPLEQVYVPQGGGKTALDGED